MAVGNSIEQENILGNDAVATNSSGITGLEPNNSYVVVENPRSIIALDSRSSRFAANKDMEVDSGED